MPIERVITGVETFLAFLALLYLISWQVRLVPRDQQEWSALLFAASICNLMGQLTAAYLLHIPLGTGLRGNISYGLFCLATVWFAYCTKVHNARLGKSVRRDRDA